MPAGALTLVIEEAMAREDQPAAFPEPEPELSWGDRVEVERGGKKVEIATLGSKDPQKGEEKRDILDVTDSGGELETRVAAEGT